MKGPVKLTGPFYCGAFITGSPTLQLAGEDLDVIEETFIRSEGGLAKRGGSLANKRHQMNGERYRAAGAIAVLTAKTQVYIGSHNRNEAFLFQ